MRRRLALCAIMLVCFAMNGLAQVNPVIVGGMKWRQIGPFRGGRVLAVTGVPGDPNTYYFGAVAGGIFKSTNGGLSWTPVFDHEDISSIGAIAVSDSDHNILYAGSGEACLRGNISYGDGVYKSTDAGHTWKNVGLKDTRHIGAVIIDPRNPDIVLVAALGHAWGPNCERGIFRTADGGKTWREGPLQGRQYRSGGSGIRSQEFQRSLRGAMAGSAPALVLQQWRTGQRPVQICRRRTHLEATDRTMVCRKATSDASAFRFREPIPIACTRSSKPKKADFIAPTMPAIPGRG